ncbi:MAG: DUF4124 domain-containing protein [Polaromonas sp.]|nr:DUF4124 domain-containing protein [Polaromonas sp.]
MNLTSAFKTLAVALLTGLVASTALAQWQWVDADGKKVFSDLAPPAGTPDKNILKRPNMAQALPAAAAADGSATLPSQAPVAEAAAALKVGGKDPQLEARKKQADDEAAAKKKIGEEKVAKAKAENCDAAKRNLRTLDSGVRIASTNAKGEREMMDDSQLAEAKKRTQGIAQSNCQ